MDQETFVKNYLERISHSGGREPSLKNLSILQREHSKAIPFENTYVLKKMPINLNKEWIYDKIMNKGRGGFCFEVNYLFYLLLKDLGYDVKFLGGSVFHPITGQPGHPNEHVLSMVTLEGQSYIVDVGFGAKCALEPLPLVFEEEFVELALIAVPATKVTVNIFLLRWLLPPHIPVPGSAGQCKHAPG